jgi:hypothetical protein
MAAQSTSARVELVAQIQVSGHLTRAEDKEENK